MVGLLLCFVHSYTFQVYLFCVVKWLVYLPWLMELMFWAMRWCWCSGWYKMQAGCHGIFHILEHIYKKMDSSDLEKSKGRFFRISVVILYLLYQTAVTAMSMKWMAGNILPTSSVIRVNIFPPIPPSLSVWTIVCSFVSQASFVLIFLVCVICLKNVIVIIGGSF